LDREPTGNLDSSSASFDPLSTNSVDRGFYPLGHVDFRKSTISLLIYGWSLKALKKLFVSPSVHGERGSEGVRCSLILAVLLKDLMDDCILWLVREE
jgi:hypothetical protein